MTQLKRQNLSVLKIYRFISIVAIFVLIAIEILHFRQYLLQTRAKGFYEIIIDISNVICIGLFVVLSFFPQKIELFGTISYIYAFLTVFFEPSNPMSYMMFILGTASLHLRGFMKKNGFIKDLILILIYMGLLFSELRFGFLVFLDSFLEKLGFFLTSLLIYVFLEQYMKNAFMHPANKYVDLTQFELTERDKEWIKLILNNDKYDYIAKIYNLNSGTVKHNCRRIYQTLGVADRQDFITKYAGFVFLYTSDEVESYKKEMYNSL